MDGPRNGSGTGVPGESVPANGGTLPVCAWCKRVRDGEGAWAEERAAGANDEARRSHGLCPECFARLSEKG